VVFGKAVDKQVVHDAALPGAHEGVEDGPIAHFADIVGEDILQKRARAFALEVDFPHVADIEEAHAVTDRQVLLDNAGVLNGHTPTREGHHFRSEFLVDFEEGRGS
jgi:hypothetical protein